MEKKIQVWNEYHGLREELRIADSLNYQIMGIIIGAVALILTTGVGQAKPSASIVAFLCSYVVTYPGYRLFQGNRRRIWRISTYMRTFLEPNLGSVKWETRLSKQREYSTQSQGLSSLVSQNEWFTITLLNVVAGFAAMAYIFFKLKHDLWVKILLLVFIVLLNLILAIKTRQEEKSLRRLGKIENEFIESWKLVLDRERLESDLGAS